MPTPLGGDKVIARVGAGTLLVFVSLLPVVALLAQDTLRVRHPYLYVGWDFCNRMMLLDTSSQQVDFEIVTASMHDPAGTPLPGLAIGGDRRHIKVDTVGFVTAVVKSDKGSQTLWLEARPLPVVLELSFVNRSSSALISKSLLRAWVGPSVRIVGFDAEAYCQVVDYVLRRVSADGSEITVTNDGQALSDEARRMVASLAKGETLFIEAVRYECPGRLGPLLANGTVIQID